jgi:REP element-mobilizing transposase RayT
MYCRIPITKPISTIIWYIKWRLSHEIKKDFRSEIKKWYWKTWEIWATWYFVASVWEIKWEIISKYVENQWKEENEVIEIEL